MFKYEIKYGVITGAGICLWILLEFLLYAHAVKMNIGLYSVYLIIIIPLITTYLGIKEKRDKQNNGIISFSNGIRSGLMISLIAAVIISIFIIVYSNYIDSGFFEHEIAYREGKLFFKEKTGKEIVEKLKIIKTAFRFVNRLLFVILWTVATGLIISIVFSFILKKNKFYVKN
jgi:hypothetical protein